MRISWQIKKLLFGLLLALTSLSPAILPNQSLALELDNSLAQKPQIAILLPLSGPFSDLGKQMQKGFKLGFERQNTTILKERNFAIKYFDSQANPETTRTLINLLNSEGGTVIAAGTPLNTTAWTTSKSCEENGLPFLIVGADQNNLINDKSHFSFRLNQPRSARELMLSQFIASQDPAITNMGIIYEEGACAIRQARRLRKFCAKQEIDLAIWEVYRRDERNFYDLLNIIKERQPQLLILATGPATADKLWQQGQRLELMPSVTIVTPINCSSATSKPTSLSHLETPILYSTPWLTEANRQSSYPLENHIQAQGYAAAELLLESLNRSLDLTSGEIVKALEETSMTTAYGAVNFSGPGLGHQNPRPWYLTTFDENGNEKVVFPLLPPDHEITTSETAPATTKSIGKPETKKNKP